MKRKFKQRCSTISPRSTKRTITSHLISWNRKKTTTYGIGNQGPGLRQAQKRGVVKTVNWM